MRRVSDALIHPPLLLAEVMFVDAVQMVVVETVATLVEEVQVVALAKQGTQ